jgi:hypothetical protein
MDALRHDDDVAGLEIQGRLAPGVQHERCVEFAAYPLARRRGVTHTGEMSIR